MFGLELLLGKKSISNSRLCPKIHASVELTAQHFSKKTKQKQTLKIKKKNNQEFELELGEKLYFQNA